MKLSAVIFAATLLLIGRLNGLAQGFVNLGFENTTPTRFLVNEFNPDYYATNATVPGWDWSPHFTAGFGDPNTTVALNNLALDSPFVTLQGTNSPYAPAIRGEYSILLQGGSQFVPSTSYSAIWQTGQIPTNAESLIYWGGALQVTFNGQPLIPVAISNAANYIIWGMDISAYAGQTGELRFTKPWLPTNFSDGALLDNIQFSSSPIPEPSPLALTAVGTLLLGFRRWKHFPR
jgi:hypothetical protein